MAGGASLQCRAISGALPISVRYRPYRLSDCFDAYSLDCVTRNQTKKTTRDSNSVANAIESILLLVCVLIRSFLCDVHARDKTGQCGT